MAIIFSCQCGKKLSAQEQHAGYTVRCPTCGREMAVPQASGEAPTQRSHQDAPDEDYRQRRRRDGPAGTSGLAVGSLICGILGLCFAPLGLVGLILGIIALVNINRSQGRVGGTGLAIGGIVASLVSMLIILPAGYFAIQRVRDAANRMRDGNNLKQFGIAIHNYHSDFNYFPSRGPESPMPLPPGAQPLLSWRVAILPYIEQEQLYRQFRLNEPWDSPHNIQLLERMPKMYEHPSRTTERPGWTYYQAFTGTRAAFDPSTRSRLADVVDGTSNTLMLAEAAEAVPWTKPEDIPFDFNPGAPLPKLGGGFSGGYNVLFVDGSVSFLRNDLKPETLRKLIDRRDGEMIDRDNLK